MVEYKNGGHEGMALVSDAPSTRTLDLGDESVHMKPLEEPGDAGRLSPGLGGVAGGGEQVGSNVPVGESGLHVRAVVPVLSTKSGAEPQTLQALYRIS